jgi:aryl-alcohol dehydrogenase
MRVTAAIATEPRAPFSIAELDIDEPRPDEILVRMVSSGVCHTDLVVRDRATMPPLPAVLGHEGAGVVERVGTAVRTVKPGDHVVLSFASCGSCTMCRGGHPAYCADFIRLNFSGRREDGSASLSRDGSPAGSHFFGQSSFASHAIANERCAVKVPLDAPLRDLGPLGCGIQTGAGAVFNGLGATSGTSIAIFGTGAVGLAALLAAVAAGCSKIVAVDKDKRRLDLAGELGATHTFEAADLETAVIVDATHGGADFSVDTTGVPAVVRMAIESLKIGGSSALHGAPQPGDGGLDLSALPPGRTVTYLVEGHAVPQEFIPRLLRLQGAGRFPFEKLLRHYDFVDINRAVEDSLSGATIKPVLTF